MHNTFNMLDVSYGVAGDSIQFSWHHGNSYSDVSPAFGRWGATSDTRCQDIETSLRHAFDPLNCQRMAPGRRDWCNPIPVQPRVGAVHAFLKAFHDESTVEKATCAVFYLKQKPRGIEYID